MKYSNVFITDENMDYELEQLCKKISISNNNCEGFTEKLEDGYTKQQAEGFDEWIKCGSYPNKGSDFRQAIQKGFLAYEFANGFLVFNFESIL